jgi:DNA-directed RNA polymerase specialized sigma24 family protein
MNSAAHSDKFPSTDEVLVEMIRLDHEWALKEIFLKYNMKLYRMAVGVLGRDDVSKDIVQEIFIDLWNRRHHSEIRSL